MDGTVLTVETVFTKITSYWKSKTVEIKDKNKNLFAYCWKDPVSGGPKFTDPEPEH
jgi:hypothetical protein